MQTPDNLLDQNRVRILFEREISGPLRADTLRGGPKRCFCVAEWNLTAIGPLEATD